MTDDLHLEHLGACRTAFRGSPEACGRILLVGEDNPQSARPEHALFPYPEGCAGNRLQEKILRVPRADYLAMWRTNLCCPTWSTRAAKLRGRVLLDRGAPWDLIVCLGAKVAGVMIDFATNSSKYPEWEPFTVRVAVNSIPPSKEIPTPMLRMVYLPHPSGRNRVWNAPGPRARVLPLMRTLAPDIAWGRL